MASTTAIPSGVYKHHGDWVTAICTAADHIVTASRDKTLCVWDLSRSGSDQVIRPRSLLTGHNHIVQDLVLSSDGQYAISASWDKTLRLWDLNKKKTIANFTGPKGHKHDVLSVSFSKGNRQIISAGRDKTIKLWNIHGTCKHTTAELPEWVTCAKFGMRDDTSDIVSGGYDRLIRVWDRQTFTQKYALSGHAGYINTVAISPDSTLVASGGQDKVVNMWDITAGQFLYPLPIHSTINHIEFSPNRFMIAVACDAGLKLYDLKKKALIADLKMQPTDSAAVAVAADDKDEKAPKLPKCVSCQFSTDGQRIFAGYSDSCVRCWTLPTPPASA